MSGKHYSIKEIEYLKNNLNNKIELPNRSEKSIRRQLVILGLIQPKIKMKPHSKKKWTQAEINALKNKKAFLLKRTKNSIRRKLRELNLVQKEEHRKHWPENHNEILIGLVKEKKTAKEIFNMKILPYSKNSIQKKMCYLGLCKSKSAPIEKYDEETLNKFKKFLENNWQGKIPEDLEQEWNESNNIKTNKRKVLYHLYRLGIKIPYGEVASIKNLRKKEELIKSNYIGSSGIAKLSEHIRIARAKLMQRRIEKNRDIWTGLPLKEPIDMELEI
jgi:hypothetical protein